jgi:hypothetical protein
MILWLRFILDRLGVPYISNVGVDPPTRSIGPARGNGYVCMPADFSMGRRCALRIFSHKFAPAVSKFLFFMGGKVFLIHLFAKLPISNSATTKWTRCTEASPIPWIRFTSLLLSTVQLGPFGFLFEIFRERMSTRTFRQHKNSCQGRLLCPLCFNCVLADELSVQSQYSPSEVKEIHFCL